jgi:FOG: WD40 repeat
VIRHYHGHLSSVNTISLHPTIDVLITAGRDSTARVWDVRTKANVYTLTGHTNTIASVVTQASEPQVGTKTVLLESCERIMFVLGTAGFLLSCLPSLLDFGTIRPWQLQFPLSTKPLKKYLES